MDARVALSTVAVAAAVLGGCKLTGDTTIGHTFIPSCQERGAGLAIAPDSACTPGAWIADGDTSYAHVCRHSYNPRPSLSVTSKLKRRALKLYGLPSSAARSRELDHLYPVWAGGATTIGNLWPEPNYAQPPDTYTHNPKDALEFVIYKLTCQRHKLTVDQARLVFEGDWRTEYAKYIGPVPTD